MRSEVAKLRAEVDADEHDEKPKRKRRPRLRLIKGGGIAALIAAPLGRYWREAAAASLVGAATAGVLVLPSPGPVPDEVRVPETLRTTAPVAVSPKPSAARSSHLPARPVPSATRTERKGTVAPKTPSERSTGDVEATSELVLPSSVSTLLSLPPLPTRLPSLISQGSCLVTIGTVVSICVPTEQ